MRYILTILCLISAGKYYCQVSSLVQNAIFIIIKADNDLLLEDSTYIKLPNAQYEIISMKQSGIIGCEFYLIKFGLDENEYCKYVIAHSDAEHRYFRLMGFKYNEFNEFYDLVLANGSVMLSNQNRKKTRWRNIREQVTIEGFDLKKAYNRYYRKYKSCLYDSTSCYRNSIIRRY